MRTSHFLKAILFCSLVGSSAALAATTDTVTLSGTVFPALSIDATDTSAAAALPLTKGEKITKVADMVMTSNNATGLTLSATSGNLTSGANTISFQVRTVTHNATPAAADFTTASGDPDTFDTLGAGSFTKDLFILYTPSDTQAAGTYTGTIDLTVTDNA
jgi:hypothetical protein